MISSKWAKRPSKQEAFAMIKKLKNEMTLDEIEVDSLLMYFIPSTPKSVNTAEKWAALAVGKEDKREFVNYLHVIDGFMYGIDGHRIHKCKTSFANGTYDPKTLLKTNAEIMPANRYKVVQEYFNKARLVFNTFRLFELNLSFKSENYDFATLHNEKILVNRKYALEGTNGNEKLLLNHNDQCIYGEHSLGQFCIMLMRR